MSTDGKKEKSEEEIFDAMFEAPRPPRSLQESPNFRPCWRWDAARQYLLENAAAAAKGEIHDLPAHEDDDIIRELYVLGKFKTNEDPVSYRWARDADRFNLSNGTGSRIRAMAIAGLTDQQIAEIEGTTPKAIDIFLKTYYDVRPYLSVKGWIECLIFSHWIPNGYDNAPDGYNKEHFILAAARLLPWDQAKRLIFSHQITPGDVESSEWESMIDTVLAVEAAKYAIALRTQDKPRPASIERWMTRVNSKNIAKQFEQTGGGADPMIFIRSLHTDDAILNALPPEIREALYEHYPEEMAQGEKEKTIEPNKIINMPTGLESHLPKKKAGQDGDNSLGFGA